MGEGYNLKECLEALHPSNIDYTDWIQIGMALKHEGYGFGVWDSWSSQDTKRYKGNGAMQRKWAGFGSTSANPVTGGTIVQMARDSGWTPAVDLGEALSWDGEVYDNRQEGRIVDPTWVEAAVVEEPGNWHGWEDLARYLETLFEPSEVVGYVVDSWDKDGRWLPSSKGPHTDTAGELIARLNKSKDDLGASVGFNNTAAGAWIRFNPLDGQGVRNDNVTEFRYALVESDDMAIERQLAIIEQLELPAVALVHSGNKSIHAIVHVDAKDYDEYRKRVDFLYETCRKNGLKVDTQNKNPSRLSRMPGVMRNGNKQWLMATNTGRASWNDWREWLEEQNDDLPDPESLADVWNDLPELSPPLIDRVLRQGHKMMLGGPSKAGKSFALIELCIALAEGHQWLGFDCAQGRVLYVNLELDRASCLHRFKDVYKALGIKPANVANIDVWNLRGKSKPMDKLAPSLIRRSLKTRPIAVVIDPIYKVITGDENSADQMAAFCNQFDKVANELGCAVIYCHHHSKGTQGAKRSMDRVSGSGVFARDPDALLDMIELEQTDALKQQQEDEAVCAALDR
ncbi:MAG: AAA family ATPase, partial [Gordonibacter sp.]|uniref:AAA family ATPase n=1 Tax=Gordonibacter sp. TaxID=1968902 RepID=UPI002FC6780A